jgi:hypothetical protein
MAGSDAVYVNAVNIRALRSCFPSAAQQFHGVAAVNEPAEDLMKVKLCTARLRVFAILPVEYKYSH